MSKLGWESLQSTCSQVAVGWPLKTWPLKILCNGLWACHQCTLTAFPCWLGIDIIEMTAEEAGTLATGHWWVHWWWSRLPGQNIINYLQQVSGPRYNNNNNLWLDNHREVLTTYQMGRIVSRCLYNIFSSCHYVTLSTVLRFYEYC